MMMGSEDGFTDRMLQAINGMLHDMLAAIARKDYDDRRRRHAQEIARTKAEGRRKGRPETWRGTVDRSNAEQRLHLKRGRRCDGCLPFEARAFVKGSKASDSTVSRGGSGPTSGATDLKIVFQNRRIIFGF